MPRPRLHCCRARGARAADFLPPPPPAPSRPGLLWPHGLPRYRCLPRRLGRPPYPPAPVNRTRGARARCAQTWRRRCRRYALAGSPRCRRPPPCPAMGAAALPSSARPSACRCRRRIPAPWLLGRWRFFRLLPATVRPPLVFPCSLWSLRGFRPPGVTLTLHGCRRPVATRLPRPLHGGTSVGFPPLRRSRGPPPCPPLRGTRGTLWRPRDPRRRPTLPRFFHPYFPAGLPFAPFSPASPHSGPALPPRQRPQRGISRCCSCRPALPHITLPHRFFACPMASPSASPFPPPPPRGCRFLLRIQSLRILRALVAPLLAHVVAHLLAVPPHAALSPVGVSAHPLLVLSLSSENLLRSRPPPLAAVVLLPVSASPSGHPVSSPFLPPSPTLLPPSYLGPLRPLAPPRAPPPPRPRPPISPVGTKI